jgi:hypothetical protein
VIDTEFDEVSKSEDVDGIKHAPYLNSCSSKTLPMIRASNYSILSKINCRFYSTNPFFSVVIDFKIDEVRRSEDVDGTKHTLCLIFCFYKMFHMIRASNYSFCQKSIIIFVSRTPSLML